MLGYVYEIYDMRTEESAYVGSTTINPMQRWAGHLMDTFRNGMMPVQKYLRAQGLDLIHFGFRVREEVFWKTRLDLRKREQLWMDELKPKCNVIPAYATEEHKKKVKYACTRKWHTAPYMCECGLTMRNGSRYMHRKSAKHARLLKAKLAHTLKICRRKSAFSTCCASSPRATTT